MFYLIVYGIIEKNFLFINKKINRKNQILKYYVFSFKKLIKIIYEQLFDEKSLNLLRNWRKKTKSLYV